MKSTGSKSYDLNKAYTEIFILQYVFAELDFNIYSLKSQRHTLRALLKKLASTYNAPFDKNDSYVHDKKNNTFRFKKGLLSNWQSPDEKIAFIPHIEQVAMNIVIQIHHINQALLVSKTYHKLNPLYREMLKENAKTNDHLFSRLVYQLSDLYKTEQGKISWKDIINVLTGDEKYKPIFSKLRIHDRFLQTTDTKQITERLRQRRLRWGKIEKNNSLEEKDSIFIDWLASKYHENSLTELLATLKIS